MHALIKKLAVYQKEKSSHLCVSLDVTKSHQLLALAEQLAPYIVMLKTHIDILEDFTWEVAEKLKHLSEKHHFLLFEDRKFADIGNTVHLQYSKGIYRIVEWADIINAHILPGAGIIEGLKKSGLTKNRGLLLIAEMSSQGHFMTPEYQQQAVTLAKEYSDFVMGFIAQRKPIDDPQFLCCTPGVKLTASQDTLGQGYVTPAQAKENGADIIIVGRGIYEAEDPVAAAKEYRDAFK